MIVIHHYCVNSELTGLFDYDKITFDTLLVQFMAFGEKVCVNFSLLFLASS